MAAQHCDRFDTVHLRNADILAIFQQISTNDRIGISQHFVSQITIEGDVQRCLVRSCVMRTLRMPNGTSSIYFLGQYEDVCVKLDGQWLFESRTVRRW